VAGVSLPLALQILHNGSPANSAALVARQTAVWYCWLSLAVRLACLFRGCGVPPHGRRRWLAVGIIFYFRIRQVIQKMKLMFVSPSQFPQVL
jgi:hypothetical protein